MSGQISIFDLSAKWGTKREYPKDSLIAIDGCDYDDCFTCSAIGCRVRGEDRICRYATLGNPYPCKTALAIETDPLSSQECQFINTSLAYHRAGDHQPDPCCKKCNIRCERRCQSSKGESE